MEFLRHILRLFVVMLFSALGASMAFAVPLATSEISFYQTENLHTSYAIDVDVDVDVDVAARAPPLAMLNIDFTGGVTVMQGSVFAVHEQETVAALFGFERSELRPCFRTV